MQLNSFLKLQKVFFNGVTCFSHESLPFDTNNRNWCRYALQFANKDVVVADPSVYGSDLSCMPSAFADDSNRFDCQLQDAQEIRSRITKRKVSSQLAVQRPRSAYVAPERYGHHKPRPQKHLLQVKSREHDRE
jgi:hypothetical protein